jgi:hypothetical protein
MVRVREPYDTQLQLVSKYIPRCKHSGCLVRSDAQNGSDALQGDLTCGQKTCASQSRQCCWVKLLSAVAESIQGPRFSSPGSQCAPSNLCMWISSRAKFENNRRGCAYSTVTQFRTLSVHRCHDKLPCESEVVGLSADRKQKAFGRTP